MISKKEVLQIFLKFSAHIECVSLQCICTMNLISEFESFFSVPLHYIYLYRNFQLILFPDPISGVMEHPVFFP